MGSLERISSMSVREFADKIGAHKIFVTEEAKREYSSVFGDQDISIIIPPLFYVTPELYEKIEMARRQRGKSTAFTDDFLMNMRIDVLRWIEEITSPGIYYNIEMMEERFKDIDHQKFELYMKTMLFHELLEETSVKEKLTDEEFQGLLGHDHPIVLIGQTMFAALFGKEFVALNLKEILESIDGRIRYLEKLKQLGVADSSVHAGLVDLRQRFEKLAVSQDFYNGSLGLWNRVQEEIRHDQAMMGDNFRSEKLKRVFAEIFGDVLSDLRTRPDVVLKLITLIDEYMNTKQRKFANRERILFDYFGIDRLTNTSQGIAATEAVGRKVGVTGSFVREVRTNFIYWLYHVKGLREKDFRAGTDQAMMGLKEKGQVAKGQGSRTASQEPSKGGIDSNANESMHEQSVDKAMLSEFILRKLFNDDPQQRQWALRQIKTTKNPEYNEALIQLFAVEELQNLLRENLEVLAQVSGYQIALEKLRRAPIEEIEALRDRLQELLTSDTPTMDKIRIMFLSYVDVSKIEDLPDKDGLISSFRQSMARIRRNPELRKEYREFVEELDAAHRLQLLATDPEKYLNYLKLKKYKQALPKGERFEDDLLRAVDGLLKLNKRYQTKSMRRLKVFLKRIVSTGDGVSEKQLGQITMLFKNPRTKFSMDHAMMGLNKGGIDLNPNERMLQESGEKIKLDIPQSPSQNLEINSFVPVIFNISPPTTLPLLLGIRKKEEERIAQVL